jgi:4-hydroxy-tetrahydrodipicolinate reductase
MRTDQQPVRIALFAPEGRMGRAIQSAIAEDPGFKLDNDNGDVLIDFSAPDALRSSLDRAVSAGVPLLIGTTGLIDEHDSLIAEAAKIIPILKAPNTSVGVALLADLTERAARILGPDKWDIEIVEAHHRRKADAPSGTALHLGAAAERGRGEAVPSERGRDGTGLKRVTGAIGYSAIRGGTVAGDHDVMFLGPEERLILSHRAESRAIFARGALAAAKFLRGRPAGLYSMRDVIDPA